MQLETFTADIIVDGKALEQYDVAYKTPTKAICWVASEKGKSFSVQWKCHEASRSITSRGSVSMDGMACGWKFMWLGDFGVRNPVVLSKLMSDLTTRELMFARVQLTDDDSLLNKEIPKELGEICLLIERGKVSKRRQSVRKKDLPIVLTANSMKDPRKQQCTVSGKTPSLYRRRLKPNNDPILTFVFKYRPPSVLQANGIAPRPTPDATADNPTLEDIKPAQLNDRIQGLEDELKRLRDLQDHYSKNQKPKRVKRENRSQPLFAPGEVIGLA